MQEILCPDCQRKYTVDLQGKDGQRFRCGVCSCYFYVTPDRIVKIAERDTYTPTERKIVCPYCGISIVLPLDTGMGCYPCRCGEIYHLRKLKHSIPENDMQTIEFALSEETIAVSADTIPLPEMEIAPSTLQIELDPGESHDTTPAESADIVPDNSEAEVEEPGPLRRLGGKLAALCHPRSK